MNALFYIASYDDFCSWCNQNKPPEMDPMQLLEWTKAVGAHVMTFDPREITFDPWCYIAGYPETKPHFWHNGTLNEDLAAFVWIYTGFPAGFSKNANGLTKNDALTKLLSINKIQVFGERNSGTNFLQEILLKNTDIPLTWEYGWKHFPNYDLLKEDTDDTLFIVIVRDLTTWLHSFQGTMHHVPDNIKSLQFSDFLKKKWISANKNGHFPCDSCSTLIEKRYDYFTTLSASIQNKKVIFLKYEDLVKDQCILSSKLGCFGIGFKRIEILSRIRPGHIVTNEFFKEKTYTSFNSIEQKVINEQTNIEIEKKMGY